MVSVIIERKKCNLRLTMARPPRLPNLSLQYALTYRQQLEIRRKTFTDLQSKRPDHTTGLKDAVRRGKQSSRIRSSVEIEVSDERRLCYSGQSA